MDAVSQLIEAINSSTAAQGGTSMGLSRDKKARACGMAAAFSAAKARPPTRYPEWNLDAKGKPRVIGSRAGTAFHALNEQQQLGRLPAILPTAKQFHEIDADIAAALTALGRYTDAGLPGVTLGVEVPVAGLLGGRPRTGRIDRLVHAEERHVNDWAEFGLLAAEPGLYLWDYKLYKAVTHALAEQHSRDMQALAYLRLYHQTTGVRPNGLVYDLVSRAGTPTIWRLLVLVSYVESDDAIVDWYVQRAEAAREAGEANTDACDNRYGTCPFIGVCPRYGTAKQHENIIESYKLLRADLPEDDEDE